MNRLLFLTKLLGQPKYVLTVILGLSGFYLLNALMTNISNIWTFGKEAALGATSMYALTLIKGFPSLLLPSTLLSLIITGTLMGLLFALMQYNFTINKTTKVSGLAKVGIFFGTVAPGCAACCGIGLAAALGIGTVFATLPYQGREISYIVIAILIFSIYRTTGKLVYGCKV